MASGTKLTLFELRVIELKAELEKRNIDNMGVKAVLVKRLKEAMIGEGLDPETYVFNLEGKTSPSKKLTRSESKPDMESPKDESPTKDIKESSITKNDDDKSSSSEEKKKDTRVGGSRKSLRQKSSSSKEESVKSEESNTDKTVSSGSEGNLSINETNSAEKVSLGKGKEPEEVSKEKDKEEKEEPEEESVEDNVFCSEEKADETSEKIAGEEPGENEECPEELPEEENVQTVDEPKESADDKVDVSSDEEADLGSEAMNVKDILNVESPTEDQNGAGDTSPEKISVEEKPMVKEDNGTEDENGSEERSTNKMSEEADDEKEATNEETTDIESDKSPVRSESSKASSRKRKRVSREASKDDFSTDADADNAQIASTHDENASADGDADNTEKDEVNGPSYDKITESVEGNDGVRMIDLDVDDMEDMEADAMDEIEPSGGSPGRELSTEEIVDEVMNVEDKSDDALVADDTADEALEPMDDDGTRPADEQKKSVHEKSPVKNLKSINKISEPVVKVSKTMTLDEDMQQMDFDFDTLEDSECDDKPDQGREMDNQEGSLDSVEQDGIDQIEDSINLNIAEEDTKIIEEAASLEKKDASGERKQADQGKKTVDSRKGDKPHSSPSKTNTENDGKHRNLWVCNLSHTTRATDLKYIFSKHGKVVAAKIVTNARTPGARCYGYITMATPEDAATCAKALNVTELHGKLISIEVVANKPSSTKKNEDRPKPEERKPITHERKPIEAPPPDPKKRKEDDRSSSKRGSIASDEKHREGREERRRPDNSGSDRSSRTTSRDRRSPVRGALSFDQIREERNRQRLYEQHRRYREMEERRVEERRRQREVERRQKEEALRLEREREKLAMEREKIDRERAELLRLERDRLEQAKEALRRQQLKLEAAKRAKHSDPIDNYDPVPWKRQALESSRPHYPRSPSPHRSRGNTYKHDIVRGREQDRMDRLAKDSRRRDDIPPPRSDKDRLMDRDRSSLVRRDDHHSENKVVPVSHHFRYEPTSTKGVSGSDSYRKTSPGYSSSKVSYSGSGGSGSKVSGYRDVTGNWVPTKSLPPWRASSSSTSERWPPVGGYNVSSSMVPSVGMSMPPASTYTSTSDRFDAYKSLPNASRKF